MDIEVRPSWRDQIGLIFVTIMLLLATLGIWIMPVAGLPSGVITAMLGLLALIAGSALLYRHYVWRFRIDDTSIESCYGIVSRNIHSIRIRDLRNINIRQSILQRILGIGDIEFSSAGGAGIEVTFFGVAEPLALKQRIQTLEEAPSD